MENTEKELDTYQVTISYTAKQYQTFLIQAESADRIRDKVQMDFAEARLTEGEELDNLEFLEIRAVEINEKALPPETMNEEEETRH